MGAMVWKLALSFLNLPRTSWPIIVTSLTLFWSTWERNSENLMSRSLAPEFAPLTTCHNSTPESTITSQNTTVLTVEFTENSCGKGQTRLACLLIRCSPHLPDLQIPAHYRL